MTWTTLLDNDLDLLLQSTLDNSKKIVRDSESSSYRIGVSIGIAPKGPVKRV